MGKGDVQINDCICQIGRAEVLLGHTKSVSSVSISSDENRIVSGSADESVRVCEHEGSKWRGVVLTERTDWVRSMRVSSDGSMKLYQKVQRVLGGYGITTEADVAVWC